MLNRQDFGPLKKAGEAIKHHVVNKVKTQVVDKVIKGVKTTREVVKVVKKYGVVKVVKKYGKIAALCISSQGPKCINAVVKALVKEVRTALLNSDDIRGLVSQTAYKLAETLSICQGKPICKVAKANLMMIKKLFDNLKTHFLHKSGKKLISLTQTKVVGVDMIEDAISSLKKALKHKDTEAGFRILYQAALKLYKDSYLRDRLKKEGLNFEVDNRPSWLTTARCNMTMCIPCDRQVQAPNADGC